MKIILMNLTFLGCGELIRVSPVVSKSGLVHRLDANDAMMVRELNCDLLLRFGSGILRGGILNASRLGCCLTSCGQSLNSGWARRFLGSLLSAGDDWFFNSAIE